MRRAAEQESVIRPRPGAAVAQARTLPDRPSGAALIHSHVPTLPNGPGVYRMLDAKGDVLYVGKAKSLKKRLPAYAKPSALSARLQRMVALTHGVEVVTTASDVEALLLECNMIKRHRPTFNIVLRDDKSFPYIYVGKTCDRAAVSAHRAAPRRQAQGLRLFRSVRVVRRGQRDARRAAAGLPGALLRRQHLPQPHPALPAVPDQALHGALRRADRPGRLCAAARADAGVSGRAQRRHPGSAQGGDGGRLRTARVRAGGGDPRPAEGAGAHHARARASTSARSTMPT